MLKRIKHWIRTSPFGPLAMWIHGKRFLPHQASRLNTKNTKYNQETIEVMRRVLRSDSCCIDVGAHRGSILQEMRQLSPLGTHLAFEPLPHLAAHLRQTFPAVRVYEAAVSDYTGTAQFVHVENAPAYSGLQQRIYDRPDPVLKLITVHVVQLDEVIPNECYVAFIKLDIEGGEFHALRGATRTIRRCRPVIVFETAHSSTGQYGVGPEDVYCLITEQFGYHLSTVQRWLARQAPYSQTEFCQNWHNGSLQLRKRRGRFHRHPFTHFYFIAYPVETIEGSVTYPVR
jgi:FkbM family methyltransferase